MENTTVDTTEAKMVDRWLARALHVALANLVCETRAGRDTTAQIEQAVGVLDQSANLFGYWPPLYVPEGVPTGSVWSEEQQMWIGPGDPRAPGGIGYDGAPGPGPGE